MKKRIFIIIASIALVCILSASLVACNNKDEFDALSAVNTAFDSAENATKLTQTSELTNTNGDVLYSAVTTLTKADVGYTLAVTEKTLSAEATGKMYDETSSTQNVSADDADEYIPDSFELNTTMFKDGNYNYAERDGKYVLSFTADTESVDEFLELTAEELSTIQNVRVELTVSDNRAYSYKVTYDTTSGNTMNILAVFEY